MNNIIHFDPYNLDGMRRLMDEHGHSNTMFPGVNEDGETTYISIFSDKIVVSTCQSNSWFRKNIYHRDGSREETYER